MRYDHKQRERVGLFVSTALECSIYHAPFEPGLTLEELLELGSRFDFGRGEVTDCARQAASERQGNGKLILTSTRSMLCDFNFARVPEYRNRDAFQYPYDVLREYMRHEGRGAGLPLDVIVERGVQQGHQRKDLEIAIAILTMEKQLTERNGTVCLTGHYASPNEQGSSDHIHGSIPERAAIYEAIGDLIRRRTDGRPQSAEPFLAFAERLESLDHGTFRMWWTQAVQELRQLAHTQTPMASLVLSAALVEGALTFVVGHAKKLSLGPMGTKTFEGPPRSWRLEDLINSAAQGGQNAILDEPSRNRALSLNATRQRIHAGRMLEEHPKGVPDLRPEEARDAQATAELVTRRILDWLERHPTG